ncbi:hypothetical protein AMR42_15095 [Limnothrix sp. PR1529]|uniref:hypothetical protein n=1 Tax=Limnothrix sp. PR1529 TaxID=1704291 RepID=UPI000C15869A|nr:hypothetical protein [Limnothrix sp. PR1529]PIB06278.1 hypothetical protein AMR42_15095 [Limnothrix sp. PR1529]
MRTERIDDRREQILLEWEPETSAPVERAIEQQGLEGLQARLYRLEQLPTAPPNCWLEWYTVERKSKAIKKGDKPIQVKRYRYLRLCTEVGDRITHKHIAKGQEREWLASIANRNEIKRVKAAIAKLQGQNSD